jgi:peptide/nickel transport system substrate-binding protein
LSSRDLGALVDVRLDLLHRGAGVNLDRKAFVHIIAEAQGNVGGVMLPPPEGVWGMHP